LDRFAIIEQLRGARPQLSVGTLTADAMDQASAIRTLEQEGVKLLHVDVMDGRIFPKITVGSGFVAGLKTKLLKDVHLLVEEPEKHVEDFAKAGADVIVFALEHTADIGNTLKRIGESKNRNEPARGILRGVSIYPNTPLDTIKPYLSEIDVVNVLAVRPDTGKEAYFADVPGRVKTLRSWKPELVIVADGAVSKDNIGEIASFGVDLIATGSAVFDGTDAAANIREMTASIQQAVRLAS
jgi:ribulose-phosphate 3-epimerase